MDKAIRRWLGGLYDAPRLLLVLTMLFWAGNAVIGRFAAGHVPPVALGTLRWLGATLILLPFSLPYLRADWPTVRRHAALLSLLSLLSIAAYNTLTYWGLQFTEAINSTILQSIGPLMIVVWTFALYGERLRPRQLLGMLLSLAGVALVVSRGEPAALLGLRFNVGDLILLFAIACYALYSALLKRSPAMHPLSFVTLTMGWGTILLLPFYAAEIAVGFTAPFDLRTAFIIGYVIVFPSLLAHFFFYRGVEIIGPNRASPYFFLIPVFAAILAMLFLGERLHLFHAAGFVLVIGGILVATRMRAPVKTPSEGRPA
jgi:drug/metabolite transporter (DMT)-like permease